jgi:hypothetical protein
MQELPLLAYFLVLWTSFSGALTAGLGQGFDLGTEWPGALYRLIEAVAASSFEPIHRFSTVAAGTAVFATALQHPRDAPLFALGAAASLVATALTGRVVLLALGGEVPKPWAYFVYPINNFFAFLTAFFALALAVEKVAWRRRILLRGAAFWSVATSLSGAYILGVHKIDAFRFNTPSRRLRGRPPPPAPSRRGPRSGLSRGGAVWKRLDETRPARRGGHADRDRRLIVLWRVRKHVGARALGGFPRGVRPPDGHGLGGCISEGPAR